ncbi:MAG: carboxypeptidase regulatory-like domain-containing protein [Bacteroidota bacterium]
MKKFLLILFVNTMLSQLAAQSGQVQGVVMDSTETTLAAATVVVLQQSDSVMVNFGITEEDGAFQFKRLAYGNYLLQISFIGYENFSAPFSLSENGAAFDFGNILLSTASADLEEVLVKAEHVPVSMSRDTINYNADAFKTREGAVVEDLLKKLPGVQVQRDGTIKAQGETVNKVYVDGKEFFGNDPKIATKNLPANAIDKVQVYDKKSDLAEFSGVDDGQESKTINLQLKEDKKQGYFGSIEAGYGTQERYEGNFNLNRFAGKTQFSALGKINNVNQNGFSFDEYLNFMGGIGSFMQGGGEFSISSEDGLPLDFGRNDGFSNSASGGLNYNYDFGKKSELHLSYFYNELRQTRDVQRFRENLFDGQSFNSETFENSLSANANHRLNAKLSIDIDSTQQLRFTANTTLTYTNGESDRLSRTFNFANALETKPVVASTNRVIGWPSIPVWFIASAFEKRGAF